MGNGGSSSFGISEIDVVSLQEGEDCVGKNRGICIGERSLHGSDEDIGAIGVFDQEEVGDELNNGSDAGGASGCSGNRGKRTADGWLPGGVQDGGPLGVLLSCCVFVVRAATEVCSVRPTAVGALA